MAAEEQRYRLVVLGSGFVGKSSIISRLLKNQFSESYKETVEDLHCRDYLVNGSTIKVDILDTAGNLEFPAMRRLSISTAHAFLLVYSIDDRKSFEEVKHLWEQIKEQKTGYQEMPCVIVGNKLDMASERRRVREDDVKSWADSEGMSSAWMEVSAKDGTEVPSIFYKLLGQANIPAVRKLEPLLKRRLSGNAAQLNARRLRLEGGDEKKDGAGGPSGKVSRSRSLIRRVSRPKVKQTDDLTKNDCLISWEFKHFICFSISIA